MVRRGIEDEIAGLRYAIKQAAPISIVSRVEEKEKEYEIEAVLSGSKCESLAVWWTNSEVMEQREPSSLLEWPRRDRTRRSQEKMPIMNGKQYASMTTSIRCCVRTSKKTNGRCQGRMRETKQEGQSRLHRFLKIKDRFNLE